MEQIVSGDSVDLSTLVAMEPSSSGVLFLDGKPLCAPSSPLIIIIIIIIIIRAFLRRTMSASELNLRRRQSLYGEDG